MRKRPFSRRNGRRTRKPELLEEPRATGGSAIATIDHLGPTAVATLTVTALSTNKGVALLMDLFHEVSSSGADSLVLDIQNIEYMDSVCLGCLIQALNCAVQDGGRIALVNCEGNIQQLFKMTRLDRRFPICHDVPQALEAIERLR